MAPPQEQKTTTKPRRLEAPLLPNDVQFGPLEADVRLYVANYVAENNASGKITEPKRIALRRELFTLGEEIGFESLGTGLRTANKRGIANANYVRKAASHSVPLFGSAQPPRGDRVATIDPNRKML